MMEIKLNGEIHQVEGEMSIKSLLKQLRVEPMFLAVQYNGDILEEDDLAKTIVKAGDTLEVVRFVGGG